MNNLSIEFYEGLPFDYEDFLIEKYKSFITNCRYISVYFPNEKHKYALAKTDGQITDIFVFGVDEDTCNCYNSLVDIASDVVDEFTNVITSYSIHYTKLYDIAKIRYLVRSSV